MVAGVRYMWHRQLSRSETWTGASHRFRVPVSCGPLLRLMIETQTITQLLEAEVSQERGTDPGSACMASGRVVASVVRTMRVGERVLLVLTFIRRDGHQG